MYRAITKQVNITRVSAIGINDTSELPKSKNTGESESIQGNRTTVSLAKRSSKSTMKNFSEYNSEQPHGNLLKNHSGYTGILNNKTCSKNYSNVGLENSIIQVNCSLDSYESDNNSQ